MTDCAAPLAWVERWVPPTSDCATALDVACGRGRHVQLCLDRGYRVVAVDHRPQLEWLGRPAALEVVVADLECGSWPLAKRQFDVVVVTNYLHRPLFPELMRALAPRGRLIYQTFAVGHERFGRPRNPAYLLREHELLTTARSAGLEVLAFEQVTTRDPACVQRICARQPAETKGR
ncbi:MAG: class I SAM-dependent methyltransferase [Myxococcales bacterium FL481]|nr:MAG: class I SAM-dependent methyltransferase [Myxococcales bacterium FL481]